MANLPESATYDAGVYQIETTDAVVGGAGGKSNASAINLANRTTYLKAHVDAMEVIVTQADAEAGIATDLKGWTAQRVRQAVMAATGGMLSKSVAGNSDVTLTTAEAGKGILKLTGVLTGNINVIVPVSPTRSWIINNATTGAYTLTVKTPAGTGNLITQNHAAIVFTDGTHVYPAETNNHGVSKFTANGTFVVPQGVYTLIISGCAGGGGGGGGGRRTTTTEFGGAGGGGGAGQSIIKMPYAVTPGASVSITIGGEGSGGATHSAAAGDAGTAGGNTVAGELVTLTGGSGGLGGAGGSSAPGGGFGGAGYPAGSDGSDGSGTTTPSGSGNGAPGASSPFGGGGALARSTSGATAGGRAGGAAGGYGAGGGGGSTGVNGVGGAGSAGLVIIEW